MSSHLFLPRPVHGAWAGLLLGLRLGPGMALVYILILLLDTGTSIQNSARQWKQVIENSGKWSKLMYMYM